MTKHFLGNPWPFAATLGRLLAGCVQLAYAVATMEQCFVRCDDGFIYIRHQSKKNMTTLRSGSSSKYSANWGTAFGEKKANSSKPKAEKKSAAKTPGKTTAKKK
jgi:hypothetical protein